MYPLDGKYYSPALRGKAGEFLACQKLDEPIKERLLPDFILPSLDAQEIKSLSINDTIEMQIARIAAHWGSRPCLLDLRCLKFDSDAGSDAGRVNQLLHRARLSGCRVIPIADLTTNFYRVSAIGAHARSANSGAALRVTLSDLNSAELKQLIETQLSNLGVSSSDCLVVLDLSEADLSGPDRFAKFAIGRLVQLHEIGTWPRIVLQTTNYPRKNPASKNGQKTISRAEWLVWQRVIELDPKIRDFVMFGDFGADHGHIDFSSVGRAYTHLRYATEAGWLIVRGGAKWTTIRSVAQRIIKSGSFSGELFSAGDEFIATRARGLAGVGGPTIWRWVNMNHHMTLMVASLGALYGIPIPEPVQRRQPVQQELLVQHETQSNPSR